MEWGMAQLCHCEPIQVVFVLTMNDRMERDICDTYPKHNHDIHCYNIRQEVGHAPFGASRAIGSTSSSND
jgi:hypothetical protein